jgi:hypothetical protein
MKVFNKLVLVLVVAMCISSCSTPEPPEFIELKEVHSEFNYRVEQAYENENIGPVFSTATVRLLNIKVENVFGEYKELKTINKYEVADLIEYMRWFIKVMPDTKNSNFKSKDATMWYAVGLLGLRSMDYTVEQKKIIENNEPPFLGMLFSDLCNFYGGQLLQADKHVYLYCPLHKKEFYIHIDNEEYTGKIVDITESHYHEKWKLPEFNPLNNN